MIDQAYGRPGWHGPTLRGALRGVTFEAARRRPAPGRHSIWELALHAAYWKYIVRRRLSGDRTLAFSREGSSWLALPRADERSWKRDVALLDSEHRLLRETVSRFPVSRLEARAAESKWTYAEHIYGIAAHDAYHTGQIQLVKRLIAAKR
jgi:DinB family protein